MGTVTVNGKTYRGNTITVINGRVMIDGVSAETEEKTINISVEGNIESIKADACNTIIVRESVTGSISTASGDVTVGGTVGGSVSTMSGDVKCGPVSGSVSSMSGDIN